MISENISVERMAARHGIATTKAASDDDSGPDSNGVSSVVKTKKFGPAHAQADPYAVAITLPLIEIKIYTWLTFNLVKMRDSKIDSK